MSDDPRNEQPDDPESRVPKPLEDGLAAGFGPSGRTEEPTPSVLELIATTSGVRPRISLRDEPSETPSRVLKPLGSSAAGWPMLVEGKYQVQGEIARGGVGVILKGHDVDLGRDVAMKVLHEKYLDNPDLMQRFVEEAQIGGQLQHPGIVPVYDLGLSGDQPYFTMKLIKGRTLAALFEDRGDSGSGRGRLLAIFEQVCQTMAYTHSRGVIHRDLKPANVMVGAFGEVQVVDWGMGKVLCSGGTADEERSRKNVQSVIETVRSQPGSGSTHSIVGSVMGTPAYMPPEQANGDVEHMDERSDVFALGAILCEILTGVPPYVGESDELIIMAAKAELEPCKARVEACGADEELRELCTDCLMPAPATRPRHAGKVAERIAAYLAMVEERAREAQIEAAEERVRSRAARRSQRLTLALAASVFVTLIVAGGGAWWMESEAQGRRTVAAGRVTRSLEEVGMLLDAARAGGGADLVPWDRVAAAATATLELAELEDVPAEQSEVARSMHSRVTSGRAQAVSEADETRREARLLDRLGRVRVPPDEGIRGDEWPRHDAERQDEEYAAAFSEYFEGKAIEDVGTEEAISVLSRSDLHTHVATALDHWALLRGTLNSWDDPPGTRGTQQLWEIADRVDGEDPWRSGLRTLLPEVRESRAALERLASEADLVSLTADNTALLGEALWAASSEEQALEVFRRGRQLHPSDFGICVRLAILLWRLDEQPMEEIVEVLRVANALRPEMQEVQHLRGMGLQELGRFQEERRLWEDLLDQEPDSLHWHMHLGFALRLLGDLEGRVDVQERRIQLAGPEAEVPNLSYSLGAFRGLGSALERLGRYGEALQAFRTGHELVEAQRQELERNAEKNTLDNGQLCAEGVGRMEALLAELPLLEEVLRGDRAPTSKEEGLRAGRVAFQRQHYELAARTYGEALLDDSVPGIEYEERYYAVCAAARCGTGSGLDADSLDASQRAEWRQQAAAWLRDEIAGQAGLAEVDAPTAASRLQWWQRDPDLAGLREEAGLAELPLPERSEWRKFWAEVNVLREILRDEASGD